MCVPVFWSHPNHEITKNIVEDNSQIAQETKMAKVLNRKTEEKKPWNQTTLVPAGHGLASVWDPNVSRSKSTIICASASAVSTLSWSCR